MRQRPIVLDQYGISRWEYEELKAFCRSYEHKKRAARDLLGVGSPDMSGMPKGNTVGRPTESTALKRLKYLEDIELIERAARETDGGGWYHPLIQNCCLRVAWRFLDSASMPSSDRNAFFKARREFFWRLWQMKINTPGDIES